MTVNHNTYRHSSQDASLTDREKMVLNLILKGATDSSIAKRCGISKRTVQREISSLRSRFNVNCRATLIAKVTELEIKLN